MNNPAAPVVNQDLNRVVQEIEKDLLETIVKNLEGNKIKVEEAQKLAKDFISQLPPQDKKDLLKKLKKVSQMHPEARDVYLKYAHEEFKTDRDARLHLVTAHIQNGDVDSALTVAKGGAKCLMGQQY